MTDTNKNNNKETETEMLARLIADGFNGMQQQINGLQTQLTDVHHGLQGQINGLQNQVDELQSEVRKGFEDNRLEHKEINQHLASLDRKQIGTLESLDETVPRSEFNELSERVVVLETKMA
jgi:peptidoglycan hydrolase CwlO-like protein